MKFTICLMGVFCLAVWKVSYSVKPVGLPVSKTEPLKTEQKIAGTYTGTFGIMGGVLMVKKSGSYIYRYSNWETGRGRLYYGKWIMQQDTLVLQHTHFKTMESSGNGKVATGHLKIKTTQTERFIFDKGRLCSGKDYCLLKSK